MDEKTKALVEHAERRAEQAWQWGHTWHNADADTVQQLCAKVREQEAEIEHAHEILTKTLRSVAPGMAFPNETSIAALALYLAAWVDGAKTRLHPPTSP